METKLVVVLAIMAVASAMPANHKCIPKIYKSDFLGKVGVVINGTGAVYTSIGTVYADSTNKIQVVHQLLKGEGVMMNETYIVDDNTRMSYSIDNKSGTCMKFPSKTKPLVQFCNDSPDLMLVSSLKVGDYILDSYDYDMGVGTMTATFERESFLLIDTVMVQNIFGHEQMSTTQFGNMSTTGIPASVWKIPASCM